MCPSDFHALLTSARALPESTLITDLLGVPLYAKPIAAWELGVFKTDSVAFSLNNGGTTGREQRGHSTFELIHSYGNFHRHPMLVSATVMAKCVPENVEVVCPHEIFLLKVHECLAASPAMREA